MLEVTNVKDSEQSFQVIQMMQEMNHEQLVFCNDKETGLNETRLTTLMTPASSKESNIASSEFIEDITSSEIMLVDDLSKVFEILKEVKKLDQNRTNASGDWAKFE